MQIGNVLLNIPRLLPEEFVEELLVSGSFRIERIVSKGHRSPDGFWYDQSENEWVVLLSGAARLQVEGIEGSIELAEGAYLNLPAHVRHRVEWTKEGVETIWLAIFY